MISTEIDTGDVVQIQRHGRTYNATVVGGGPVNLKVRYGTLNGKTKIVDEPRKHAVKVEGLSNMGTEERDALRAEHGKTADEIERDRAAEERKPRMGHELMANATQERAAADLYQTDWDENGTRTVHLPKDVAFALLESCGFCVEETGSSRGPVTRWVSPSGRKYWDTEEALTQALTAITMGGAR